MIFEAKIGRHMIFEAKIRASESKFTKNSIPCSKIHQKFEFLVQISPKIRVSGSNFTFTSQKDLHFHPKNALF
jgi:hypothetical protein